MIATPDRSVIGSFELSMTQNYAAHCDPGSYLVVVEIERVQLGLARAAVVYSSYNGYVTARHSGACIAVIWERGVSDPKLPELHET